MKITMIILTTFLCAESSATGPVQKPEKVAKSENDAATWEEIVAQLRKRQFFHYYF